MHQLVCEILYLHEQFFPPRPCWHTQAANLHQPLTDPFYGSNTMACYNNNFGSVSHCAFVRYFRFYRQCLPRRVFGTQNCHSLSNVTAQNVKVKTPVRLKIRMTSCWLVLSYRRFGQSCQGSRTTSWTWRKQAAPSVMSITNCQSKWHNRSL